jgi:hypothetical protein
MDIRFFPGKDTPLKRYVSYFHGLNLMVNIPVESGAIVLCHLKGLADAIEYCKEFNVQPCIISMDGVRVDEIPEGVCVISFRPSNKKDIGDEFMYHKHFYYKSDGERSHHPLHDQTGERSNYGADITSASALRYLKRV